MMKYLWIKKRFASLTGHFIGPDLFSYRGPCGEEEVFLTAAFSILWRRAVAVHAQSSGVKKSTRIQYSKIFDKKRILPKKYEKIS